MKTKFGAIIVDGRGKIGGHVASKNRGGSYLRTKVTPSNARTVAQLGVRSIFTSLSQAWRGLTQAQRDAWNAAVANFQKTNVFGDLRTPSGANLYQSLNNNLSTISQSLLDTPPVPTAVAACTAVSLSAAVGTPAISLVLNAAVPDSVALVVMATAPQSAGKSFLKNQFRLITVLDPEDATPANLLPSYVAKFGNTGAIGQKIAVKVYPIDITTGIAGGASEVSVITTA